MEEKIFNEASFNDWKKKVLEQVHSKSNTAKPLEEEEKEAATVVYYDGWVDIAVQAHISASGYYSLYPFIPKPIVEIWFSIPDELNTEEARLFFDGAIKDGCMEKGERFYKWKKDLKFLDYTLHTIYTPDEIERIKEHTGNIVDGKETHADAPKRQGGEVVQPKDKVHTSRANYYFEKAVEQGLMIANSDGTYKWELSNNTSLCFFFHKIYRSRPPYKELQKLFGVKLLSQKASGMKESKYWAAYKAYNKRSLTSEQSYKMKEGKLLPQWLIRLHNFFINNTPPEPIK